jgi:DNA polymerase III delta subunit
MSGVVKNLFWLCGDRYQCQHRKKEIIEKIRESGEVEIKDITNLDANSIYGDINGDPLFGMSRCIFVHDGLISSPVVKKLSGLFENMPKDRFLIILDAPPDSVAYSPDKRNVIYKRFSGNIEVFEAAFQKTGFINRKIMLEIEKKTKDMIKWEGSDNVFSFIFKKSGYDIGITIQEIEKIRIYLGRDEIKGTNDLKDIFSASSIAETDDILEDIIKGDIKNALIKSYLITKNSDIKDLFMQITGTIIENLTFMGFCCLAIESGKYTPNDIGEYVSNIWVKNGKKMDSRVLTARYYVFREKMKKITSKQIFDAITSSYESIKSFTLGIGPPTYLLRQFIVRSSLCFC